MEVDLLCGIRWLCTLNTDSIQLVRGSAIRTLWKLGSVLAIGVALLTAALWLCVNDGSATQIAVSFLMVIVAGVILLCACVASSTTIAEVRDGRLNFYFCGIRTRSISLDASTMFELRTIGRLKVLSIQSSGLDYVPNGALDTCDVIDLLRANGVAERWRIEFIDFLERLIVVKGRVEVVDWNRFIITHYPDEEIEEMRRTIARLQHSWAHRDWPELNLELVAEWVKKLRQSVTYPDKKDDQ